MLMGLKASSCTPAMMASSPSSSSASMGQISNTKPVSRCVYSKPPPFAGAASKPTSVFSACSTHKNALLHVWQLWKDGGIALCLLGIHLLKKNRSASSGKLDVDEEECTGRCRELIVWNNTLVEVKVIQIVRQSPSGSCWKVGSCQPAAVAAWRCPARLQTAPLMPQPPLHGPHQELSELAQLPVNLPVVYTVALYV